MMHRQLERYARLLVDEKCAREHRIGISAQNDSVYCYGADDLSGFAADILQQLDCTAIIIAEPKHPFPFLLAQRLSPASSTIVPGDSESKTSLHDIPVVRRTEDVKQQRDAVCAALKRRKGCIVEGIGMVSQGALTIEQAYITWSSLMHATTIKFLADLLAEGPASPNESSAIQTFKSSLQPLCSDDIPVFLSPLTSSLDIVPEMCRAGQTTVRMGLVDSFFGNISWSTDDRIYISQTSARMDELAEQIDQVPFDGSTTTGLTASSELPAHTAVVRETGVQAIVHGHPKFPVIMSFFCTPGEYDGMYDIDDIPVVQGEGGMGGLAESLPKAFKQTGKKAVIVKGHGVFAISQDNFKEALYTLARVEQQCREGYFQRLEERFEL